MPRLVCCPACHGFIANPLAACPHCAAVPPPRRRLTSFLASVLLATTGAVTLMACYGVSPNYQDCQYDNSCGGSCDRDDDCAPGEYCDEAYTTCEYGGSCSADVQCPDGYRCDEARATCVPAGVQCTSTADCLWNGERCEPSTGVCVATTACAEGGAGCAEGEVCDDGFGVCVPCEGEACGTCAGESTCGALPPLCPEGTQPAIAAGCYTGGCVGAAACAAEACAALDEATCVVSDGCDAVYRGIGCTDPEGDPCTGQGACSCESFVYDRCVVAPPPA